MKRRLVVLCVLLIAVIACYVVVLRVAPEPGASTRKSPAGPPPPGSIAATLPGGPGFPSDYENVSVQIKIPALSEFPAPWSEGAGCPQKILSAVLGAAVGPGGGVPVLNLAPDKPAAKAGIKVGDRLGDRDACPSSLYTHFFPKEKPYTVQWTVHRPQVAAAPKAPAAQSPTRSR
jgi:membrane-associated protease RseP (regulator of RpoE activity)